MCWAPVTLAFLEFSTSSHLHESLHMLQSAQATTASAARILGIFFCLTICIRVLQSAQATTASAARILPSGPSDASLPQPNGTAAMDEDDDMGVPGPSSSRPASAGQGRAGSRPPTAPESVRGRQATLGEAFGRSGRSTQQVGLSSRLSTAASVLQNKQGAGISKNLRC